VVNRVATRTLVAALVASAIAACIDPDYQCKLDRDCDVGVAGRCELDHRCTAIDAMCATHRRYSEHSGPRSGTCFDDHVAPIDLCAAGQPPATTDGCAATVCQALPTCCSTGWSEACVQEAQILCSDVACDTRIAITANKPGHTELWDLRWNGARWTAQLDMRQSVLAWLAPAPGSGEPRLAGFAGGAFVADSFSFPVAAARNYIEATSVDFDRDGRATTVLGFTDTAGPHLEITKLDDGSSRVVASTAVTRLSWGDVDHDAFPDGIAEEAASNRYHLLSNNEADDHSRAVDDRVVATVNGGTAGSGGDPPPIRSFDWLDIDGDTQLDVVAYGFNVDVHSGKGDAIGTSVLIRIDCDPPGAAAGCDAIGQAAQAFAGAGLPARTGSALVIATHPVRALYRAELRGTPATMSLMPYTFPTEACAAACAPIIAVVVRDLDGDHALDVVAIDANLQVYTSLAKDNLVLRAPFKIPTIPAAPGFFAVRTSVTGVKR
jgi:hypothetical protein